MTTVSKLGEDEPIDQASQRGYHPLAQDRNDPGFWGWIDRQSDRCTSWLNPILIKEARQSLKSKQFLITFFLMLLASWFWTVTGIVMQAPDVYYTPAGKSMLVGYYFVLAIPLIAMVPIAAHRSLVSEIDDGTFEMLAITRLSSMRIVMGKLNSAMLQMLVYFAAIVPCLAFSYLIRGIDLPTIAMILVIIFFTALLVSAVGLLLATVTVNRAGQMLSLLAVFACVLFAEFTCAGFCIGNILFSEMGSSEDAILFLCCFIAIGTSCIVIFVRAAAARIAPVTENRSTPLRWCMFGQQLLWIVVMTVLLLWYGDSDPVNFGIMVLGGYWLAMGTLMLGESPELSPRVQRDLPKTYLGRMLLTWFNPGPGTGFIFAIASGTVGSFSLGLFATIYAENSITTQPLVFAMITVGYLMGYLGVVRLIVMPLSYRLGRSFVMPCAIMALVMAFAAITPIVLTVIATGSAPYGYEPIECLDWAWTFAEAFTNPYSPPLALLIFCAGMLIAFINLLLLFREFRYTRVAVPKRVLQDQTI